MSRKAYDTVKRGLDLTGGLLAYTASLPLQAVIAVTVLCKLGRPVLFRQSRPGIDAKPFMLLKFRTMLQADPQAGRTTDEERLTAFGAFLRSTSLDELPSLLNVIKGEMSFVGPRPLLMSYLARYSPEQQRRHDVRPGITGLAQATGRNALPWGERLRLDVQYVNSRSLKLDLRILASTLGAVVRREGISADGHVTTPEFTGTTEGRSE